MTLALIVAAARNRVIGLNNAMPWHLPADLRYFKQVTLGKPVIMGRNTFESIGRPLPGRDNIVVTRNPAFEAAGVSVVHSLEEALALGSRLLSEQGRPEAELMLIGGAQLYAQAMPLADRLYITEVDAEPEGDAWFPVIDKRQWQEVAREHLPASAENPYACSFCVLERKAGSAGKG
ncbi:MAG TPA: type 3 dihydrofolate reductase [Pseudomonadaceae bacterium]|nr:type 3 dihydrofolate reductase [Pseudomonadaceae bacterium]